MTKRQIHGKRDFRSTTKKDPKKSQAADYCQTPQYALDPLLPYLDSNWRLWESACGQGNLVTGLQKKGFNVIGSDILGGCDFFEFAPNFDCQVTNPPYSIKLEWLERSYSLGKPFALLLPVELLGVGKAQRMFKANGIEVLLLNKRIDFQTVNTKFEKSSSWFPTAWYTWGLNVGQTLTFCDIIKRPDSQLMMFGQNGNGHKPDVMTDSQFNDWIIGLQERYPQITDIRLVGSRAFDCAREDSDWDVILCLDCNCYDIKGEQINKIEQRIAFDPELKSDREALDIFFLRPKGWLKRWCYGPDEKYSPMGDEYIDGHLKNGDLAGDFSRLYRSLSQAKIIYDGNGQKPGIVLESTVSAVGV